MNKFLSGLTKEDIEALKKTVERSQKSTQTTRKGADYRYRDTPVKQQFGGTCTAFAGTAGIENLLNMPKKLNLSERDAWSRYKQYSCAAFVKALTGKKICEEKHWPQQNTWKYDSCDANRKYGLVKATYLSDDINSMLDTLDKGHIVYLGLSTPNDMLSCRSVIRTTSSFSNGGHAISVVGYKMDNTIRGGGYFIIKNSWGRNCGDNGYQYLPFYTCNRNDGYCIAWSFSKVTPEKVTPEKPNKPETPVKPNIPPKPKYKRVKYCKRIWWTLWTKTKCWYQWVEVE